MVHGRLYQRLRCGFTILALQIFTQRSCIHAYTDRNAFIARTVYDRTHFTVSAYVARINPQAIDAVLDNLKRNLVVKMDVGNQWHCDLFTNPSKRFSRLHTGH